MIRPKSREWCALRDPRDRFRVLTDAIIAEQGRREPDAKYLAELHEAWWAYRARCTKLSAMWDGTNNLSVSKTPDGKNVLYLPRKPQLRIHRHFESKRVSGKPVRLLLPKSRHHGVTTAIAVEFYHEIARHENVNGLVVAHKDAEAQVIFESKYTYLHEHDPLAPKAARSSTTEMFFPDLFSSIEIRSAAGRLGVARGGHYKVVHLSEVAFFDVDPHELFTGIMQGVPLEAESWSAVVLESTLNGQSGLFYDMCREAIAGESDWDWMFLPVHERAGTSRSFQTEDERVELESSITDEERLYIDRYGCTLENIHWLRYAERNLVHGETDSIRRAKRKQEHPVYFDEAAQSSGDSAFDIEAITSARSRAVKPAWQGDILAPGPRSGELALWDRKRSAWVEATPRPTMTKRANGPLVYWQYPRPGHRYCQSVDPASSGSAMADFTVMYVLDRDARKLAARYRAKGSPEQHLEPCRLISAWYNDALIIPEANFVPMFIPALLQTDRRNHIFWRLSQSEAGGARQAVKEYGFVMNQYTKRAIVDLLREKLQTEPGFFIDDLLLSEMLTFRQKLTDGGQWLYPGARSPEHDDCVVALGLALYADRHAPLQGEPPGAESEEQEDRGIAGMFEQHVKWAESANVGEEWN